MDPLELVLIELAVRGQAVINMLLFPMTAAQAFIRAVPACLDVLGKFAWVSVAVSFLRWLLFKAS